MVSFFFFVIIYYLLFFVIIYYFSFFNVYIYNTKLFRHFDLTYSNTNTFSEFSRFCKSCYTTSQSRCLYLAVIKLHSDTQTTSNMCTQDAL